MQTRLHRMVPGGRILIVSNRLPYTASVDAEGVRWQRSTGGLTAGMRHVQEQWPSLWIGWAGAQHAAMEPHSARSLPDDSVAISLTASEVEGFYNQFSNSLLWPVLHGWNDKSGAAFEDWEIYQRVNQKFADAILAHLRPGDCIWIHDYHLMLVPRLLRMRGCQAPVCFFLHTPFPELFTFTSMPQSSDLLEGMLGADLIGFHTAEYAQNFLSAVGVSLPYDVRPDHIQSPERCTHICVEPMGIDFTGFNELGADPDITAEAAALRGTSGAAVLLGVDRLDYTKGILQRLLAFERLLQQNPGLRGWVRLLQISVPTREAVHAYRDLREHVEAIVTRINRELSTSSWTPVEYLYGSVDRRTLVSLYRAADVMVVTPLRDGLNLVAKEFVASRADGEGVLVLSRLAGAAAELQEALLVTPQRIDELASALRNALVMSSAERKQRMHRLRASVASNDVFGWAARIIDRLRAVCESAHPRVRTMRYAQSAWSSTP